MRRRVVSRLGEPQAVAVRGRIRLAPVVLFVFLGAVWVAPMAVAQPSPDCPEGTATHRHVREEILGEVTDAPWETVYEYCLQSDGTASVTYLSEIRGELAPGHPDNRCPGQQAFEAGWTGTGEGTATWSVDLYVLRIVGNDDATGQAVFWEVCGGQTTREDEQPIRGQSVPSFVVELTASGGTLTASEVDGAGTTGPLFGFVPPNTLSATILDRGYTPRPQPTGECLAGTVTDHSEYERSLNEGESDVYGMVIEYCLHPDGTFNFTSSDQGTSELTPTADIGRPRWCPGQHFVSTWDIASVGVGRWHTEGNTLHVVPVSEARGTNSYRYTCDGETVEEAENIYRHPWQPVTVELTESEGMLTGSVETITDTQSTTGTRTVTAILLVSGPVQEPPAVTTTTATAGPVATTPAATGPPTADGGSGLPLAAVAGVLAAAGIGFFLWKRRKSDEQPNE